MKYNFLDLLPATQRSVYQKIICFDLTTELLCKYVESSTLGQIREDMFREGARRVMSLTQGYGSTILIRNLVIEHGRDILELNSPSQFFVTLYGHGIEAAKDWLIDVMEVPLWVVQSNVDEQVMRYTTIRTDDQIAQFFADRQDRKAHPLPLEVSAA